MGKRVLFWILVVIFLGGCATTKKGHETPAQQLQNRISYLEEELRRRDQEIASLGDELERVHEMRTSLDRPTYSDIEGKSIKQIQTALKNAGFYKGPLDGKMGPKTKEAIRAFQRANGLMADGVVGKKTLRALDKYF